MDQPASFDRKFIEADPFDLLIYVAKGVRDISFCLIPRSTGKTAKIETLQIDFHMLWVY